MAYTADQYKAAEEFIRANLDNPSYIAEVAASLGISLADITDVVQRVDPAATQSQVEQYFTSNDVDVTDYFTDPTPAYTPPPAYREETTSLPAYIEEPTPPPAYIEEPTPPPVYKEEPTLPPVYSAGYSKPSLRSRYGTRDDLEEEPTPPPVYKEEPISTAAPTREANMTDTSNKYTDAQYAAAIEFIKKNIDNPSYIAQVAADQGISLADLTDVIQIVDPKATQSQVEQYFTNNDVDVADYFTDATPTPSPAPTTPAPTAGPTTPAPTAGPTTPPAPIVRPTAPPASGIASLVSQGGGGTSADRYTADQYRAAGQYLLDTKDPAKVAQRIKELNLTDAEVAKAKEAAALITSEKAAATKAAADKAAADKAAADKAAADKAAANKATQDALTQSKGAAFNTAIRPTTTGDRSGTGVAIEGDSGLRSGYAPYVQRMLERASAEADVPFQKYTGESPLLESARAGIANLTTPAQFLQGSNLAQAAGIGALNYGQYKPTSFTTGTFANPNYTPQPSPQDVVNKGRGGEGGLKTLVQEYDDGGAVNVNSITPYISDNPASRPVQNYDPNTRDMMYRGGPETQAQKDFKLQRESDMQNMQNMAGGSQPINVGGPVNYGGQNISNVQASYMSPYMQNVVNAQQREAKRQSDIAGQYAGAKAAGAGAFGGSRYGLVEAENQRNLARQLGDIQARGLQDAYTSGIGQFNTEQQRSLEAQKMAEQSRQFGADLGLKGLQTGIQAGQVLGGLGQQQGYLDLATLRQMADMGKDQQQFDYNEFLRGEKYPYENLTFMKNMLSGLPFSSADSYAPGGSSDAYNTFLQALEGSNIVIPGKAEGGLISGIASLANDD